MHTSENTFPPAQDPHTQKVGVQDMRGVPETMLIPLWARAEETKSPNAIIDDPKAVEIVASIDYDFSRFDQSKYTQLGCAVRTNLFDEATIDFVRRRPGAVVVNLGAGLDTRFERLSEQCVKFDFWIDLDLPEAIRLRRKFFAETPNRILASGSAFCTEWMEMPELQNRPLLIIAEGLLMYFPESEVRSLMVKIAERFPGAEMLAETLGLFPVGRAKRHETVKATQDAPEFLWGIKHRREMERWDSRIHLTGEWDYFDYYRSRWGAMRWMSLIPGFKRAMGCGIAHLQFG